MIFEIRTYGDPVLRDKNKEVEKIDDDIREILDGMVETMRDISGIGLAAPQVGINLRMFVVEAEEGVVKKVINPEFIEYSKHCVDHEEGCLSVPGIHKKVKRPESLKVRYLNENGESVEEELEDLWARAFQHENDHLEGILFVDKIAPVAKRLVSKKLVNMKKETLKKLGK
ncbi:MULTISPECIES: peptide deformylase [Psychrilyobacter]|uniref:Peptide deformylase n=1 Tax=Psychrilyobacter piezotolerans TaxID=2293438 RepID=A0ABX9KKT5_9FUSO|nr:MULTISPECIES: peptide deformylase [Psychrilyobacter]MCS5421409.1 peptide deformylase [Psychrilyobacter sp. S5]NDI76609.1 peptide deformylase [Psychrilyobacter piezotolerans]RDE65238.1 peptide deformylase [Psychrilyobacter sp. S5]REI42856.1 peptide deformylase [Psychrilyobacter piezotolerans]